jgi:hypothetical protein
MMYSVPTLEMEPPIQALPSTRWQISRVISGVRGVLGGRVMS